ncbi:hypothetical protein BBJ29_005669 [Phytophthora kernoviae]|uniref:Uncharacterized protein n=1 Tax=Phytophthora kernoviae TaxID=325452 RepID=A0A3F2S2G7_9STRA|nr:hypothetical protein BBJ29_005669 [Phytophthora kernoviae]RLN68200.1 hypothetical protein BBP00_00001174 [Phytophthora kernoviae]
MEAHTVDPAPSDHQLLVESSPLEKFEESDHLTGGHRKRGDETEDEDEAACDVHKRRVSTKQSRRHNWQPKYEMEFGLQAIERDTVTGDVLLAICGFCKAFGREGKYEQLVQADAEAGNDTKKRRRRSLTTTKFFRAFRVDNIRSHLQGAHPRRWTEFELLPKQEAVRARFLQMQGDLSSYDHLPIVDDVVLGGSTLNSESDIAYAQAHAQALAQATAEAQHAAAAAHTVQNGSAGLNGATSGAATSRGTFDYEKHLTEQIALDRERLEFEKMRYKKEVELRERELALREKHMEQKIALQEKLCEANCESAQLESAKFYRLAEVLRDAIAGAQNTSGAASVV